jgi:hypothetical protein
MIQLSTTSEVIEALGGTSAVAALFGCGVRAVGNWRCAGIFPLHTYHEMMPLLLAKGMSAPRSLWRFERKPRTRRASALLAEGAAQ